MMLMGLVGRGFSKAIASSSGGGSLRRVAQAAPIFHFSGLFGRSVSSASTICADNSEKIPVRELEAKLDGNPFAEKYKEKLQQHIKNKTVVEDGETIITINKYSHGIHAIENKDVCDSDITSADRQANKDAEDAEDDDEEEGDLDFVDEGDLPGYAKPLSSMLRLEKMGDLSASDIHSVWTSFLAQNGRLSACIPADKYQTLFQRGKESPYFLFPLPSEGGYSFYLGMFQGHVIAFTSLLEYQTHMENAPPLLTLFHYTELKRSKGVVLMMGEIDSERMPMENAILLANQLQLYYGDDEEASAYDLVRKFNTDATAFDFNALIEKFESLFGDALARSNEILTDKSGTDTNDLKQ
eukprot:m.64265 g.64265  ORF g.64265 m.64265 type:complete len:354 (+) comp8107_c0_seq4:13-1074(+)